MAIMEIVRSDLLLERTSLEARPSGALESPRRESRARAATRQVRKSTR